MRIRIKIFVVCLFIISVVFLYFCILNLDIFSLREKINSTGDLDLALKIFFWAILIILADSMPIALPSGGAMVTVGFAIDMAIIILFGPFIAPWFSILSVLVEIYTRKLPWYRHLFNVSQLVLTVGAAGLVFNAFGGAIYNKNFLQNIPALMLSSLTYFFVNTGLISTAIGLSEGSSPLKVWFVNYRWQIINHLTLAPIGFLIAFIYLSELSYWGVILFFAPLLLARYSYKLYIDLRSAYNDLRSLYEELKRAYKSSIVALTSALEASDKYTEGHSWRVSVISGMIAREMGLSEKDIETLEFCGQLHDIGKIGMDLKEMVKRKGPLTSIERGLMMQHPDIGSRIVKKLEFLGDAPQIIRFHHEKVDGSGYPLGLKGDEIPIKARILNVADSFDAMTSDRPYRRALNLQEAIVELRSNSGKQFDKKVTETLVKLIQDNKIKLDKRGKLIFPAENLPR